MSIGQPTLKPSVTTKVFSVGVAFGIDVEVSGRIGVVTGGLHGLQASGGKGFTKDFCSVAFVTQC